MSEHKTTRSEEEWTDLELRWIYSTAFAIIGWGIVAFAIWRMWSACG